MYGEVSDVMRHGVKTYKYNQKFSGRWTLGTPANRGVTVVPLTMNTAQKGTPKKKGFDNLDVEEEGLPMLKGASGGDEVGACTRGWHRGSVALGDGVRSG